jgi:hypothetical protein
LAQTTGIGMGGLRVGAAVDSSSGVPPDYADRWPLPPAAGTGYARG